MKRFLIVFVFLSVFSIIEILAQNPGYNIPSRKKKDDKEKAIFIPDFEFLLSFSYHTSSGYFDKDRNFITDLPDTLAVPGIERRYTFDLNRYSFDLGLKYFASKELTLELKAPVTIYYLDETFLEYVDQVNMKRYMREFRERLRHSRVDYIGLSANYALYDSKFINKYFAEIRIPTGSNDGVYNDPQELWSDGAFEFTPGFTLGYSNDKTTLELVAKYNYRAEDMTDRMIGNFNFALHTVPGTRFFGYIEGAYNVSEGNDNIVFNIRQMPWQDEYLDAGFGFRFIVEQQYLGEISYKVRLDGKNAWNHAAYFINFGYRF